LDADGSTGGVEGCDPRRDTCGITIQHDNERYPDRAAPTPISAQFNGKAFAHELFGRATAGWCFFNAKTPLWPVVTENYVRA
jgi:hypothetical protein